MYGRTKVKTKPCISMFGPYSMYVAAKLCVGYCSSITNMHEIAGYTPGEK